MSQIESIFVQDCLCGLRVRYADRHVGRTVTCKQCGKPLTLGGVAKGSAIIAAALDAERERHGPLPLSKPGDPPIAIESPAPPPPPPVSRRDAQAHAAVLTQARRSEVFAQRRAAGFWSDAGRALAYARTLDAIIKTLVFTLVLTFADFIRFIPILGLIAWIAATGVVWSFYFNVVLNSAGGDDELPAADAWEGFWESGVKPFLKITLISVVLFGPAFFALGYAQPMPLVIALAALGAFLWPVTILLVSIGGGALAFRVDLAVRTAISAIGPYILICGLLAVALVLQFLAMGYGLGALPEPILDFADNPIAWSLVTNLSKVYFMIATMKVIGLFYRHFSDRFPWDAG